MNFWAELKSWIMRLRQSIKSLTGGHHTGSALSDMDAELKTHLELRTQANLQAGMSPQEAHTAARRQFGALEPVKEACHDQQRVRWLEDAVRDFGFGARQLRKNPGFTLAAIITLALGIGANTALFSVIKAVLWKPLPYGDPDRIVMLWTDKPSLNLGVHELPPSQQDIMDWRSQAKSFAHIAAFGAAPADLSGRENTVRVGGVSVSANFFSTIGVQPILGRAFTAEQEQPGGEPVVIIGHDLWVREFGGDANLLGKPITLNQQRRILVGVMPRGFSFPHGAEMPAGYNLPARTEVWLPLVGNAEYWQDDVNRNLVAMGRLKPDVALAQAQIEMEVLGQKIAQARPATHAGWINHLAPLARQTTGAARPVLLLLLAAVALVLLIACANVASLLLCRAVTRRKEMAIRAAIGASRGRRLRQLLAESLLLAFLGGGLGLAFGYAGLRALLASSPATISRLQEATLDGGVLWFALGVTLATGVFFALFPLWQAERGDLAASLQSAGTGRTGPGFSRGFGRLVAVQVGLSVMLLVGAALLLQSFQRLLAVDPGFNPDQICAINLSLRGQRYEQCAPRIELVSQVIARLGALPGVRGAAAISSLPLSGNENMAYVVVVGKPEPLKGQEPVVDHRVVSPGYFQTLGIRLLQGRDFTVADGAGQAGVTIINETLARQFFPGGDAVGQRLKLIRGTLTDTLTIVGVARDVHATAIDRQVRPGLYRPYAQNAEDWDEMSLVLGWPEAGRPTSLEHQVRHEIKALDATLAVSDFRWLDTLVAGATARPRFTSFLLSLFAATALVLTLVGIYGVVAYAVSQRARELGIRLALGAQRANVVGLVMVQGLRPSMVGLAVGAAATFGLARLLAAQLYGIQPTDPATFLGAITLVLALSLLACWLPARRAARLDPMSALRSE